MDNKNNIQHYKFGLFYYNPNDPLYFVKKLNGTGWTLNFGNKGIYLLIAMLISIVVLFNLK